MEICNTIDNLKRFVCLGLTEKISQIHENNEIQKNQQYDSKYHQKFGWIKKDLVRQNKIIELEYANS